jgi:hypothetical protein
VLGIAFLPVPDFAELAQTRESALAIYPGDFVNGRRPHRRGSWRLTPQRGLQHAFIALENPGWNAGHLDRRPCNRRRPGPKDRFIQGRQGTGSGTGCGGRTSAARDQPDAQGTACSTVTAHSRGRRADCAASTKSAGNCSRPCFSTNCSPTPNCEWVARLAHTTNRTANAAPASSDRPRGQFVTITLPNHRACRRASDASGRSSTTSKGPIGPFNSPFGWTTPEVPFNWTDFEFAADP